MGTHTEWAEQLPTVDAVRAALGAGEPLWLCVAERFRDGSSETRHFRLSLQERVHYVDVQGAECTSAEGPLGRLTRPPSTTAWIGARFTKAPAAHPYGPPVRVPPLLFTPQSLQVDGSLHPFADGRVALDLDGGVAVRAWYDAAEATLTVKVVTPGATRVHAFHGTPPWALGG